MMKSVLAIAIALTATAAQAELKMENIKASAVFSLVRIISSEGVRFKALIADQGEGSEGPALVIAKENEEGGEDTTVLTNDKLGLNVNGMFGTESQLKVNEKTGSLQVISQNSSVGRFRYERTLTVAIKGDTFRIIGFTFSSRDTIDATGESCDYNLNTGKGVRDNKQVSIKTRGLDLATASEDDARLNSCQGW